MNKMVTLFTVYVHFLEFILKSATIDLISLHWIISFGLNVWLNSDKQHSTLSLEEHRQQICWDNYK